MKPYKCPDCVHHKPTLDEAMGCYECINCKRFSNFVEKPEEKETTMNEYYLKENPLKFQVGGTHYIKYKIQPIEYSMSNGLDACQHSIVKYVTRFRDKGGVQDLEKAQQFLDILKEHYSRETSKVNR